MKIGRNDPCPCGSGKKYKKCCLSKDVPDIYQCIKDTVAENGYPSKLSDTICAMLRYMKKNNLLGGCHATASAMYVALSEQGFKTELCVGEIGSPDMSPFDHSWVTVDDKVIDLACYMPLPNPAGITNASYPIVLSTDVVTKSTPKLGYLKSDVGFFCFRVFEKGGCSKVLCGVFSFRDVRGKAVAVKFFVGFRRRM